MKANSKYELYMYMKPYFTTQKANWALIAIFTPNSTTIMSFSFAATLLVSVSLYVPAETT